MKKTELIAAAKELNEVLGLDPKIQVQIRKVQVEALEEKILEATKLIEPEDEISKETMDIINALAMPNPEESEPDAQEQEQDAGQEDIGQEEEQETEKPPVPKTQADKTDRKNMAQVMDEKLLKGGTWEKITEKVKKQAEELEYDPKKYGTGTIRAHAKYRISKGALNIELTEDGVKKKA